MTLGAVVFGGFELLDLFGPLEMFGNLKPQVEVVMVAETAGSIASFQGPRAVADVGFADCPDLDLVLLPGGFGTLREINNPPMINFLKARVPEAKLTMTVCSGSWLLARTGLLDGRRATSNKLLFDMAREQSDQVQWVPEARWVEDGPFITSSGVSAGMDMALAVIAKLFGDATAQQMAVGAEYQWHTDPDVDPFYKYMNQFDPVLLEGLKAAAGT